MNEIKSISWNELYHKVYNDVDWNNCSRVTQNYLKEIKKRYDNEKLENKLLKLECIRLFNKLAEIVDYKDRFDLNYLENWIKEQKNENSK